LAVDAGQFLHEIVDGWWYACRRHHFFSFSPLPALRLPFAGFSSAGFSSTVSTALVLFFAARGFFTGAVSATSSAGVATRGPPLIWLSVFLSALTSLRRV